VLEAGHGGDGGAAGDAGAARVHYTTVKPPKVKTGDSGVFPATYRAPILTEPVTDWQCFHSDTISCKDARCHQNPSIAICDILTEAIIHNAVTASIMIWMALKIVLILTAHRIRL
jgi:hypothetical protein